MVEFAAVIAPLTKALGLSLGVERVLEFGKNILETVLGPSDVRQVPPEPAAEGAVEALAAEVSADAEATMVEERGEAAVKERAGQSKRLQELRARLRAAELTSGGDAGKGKEVTTLRRQVVELVAKLRPLEHEGEWAEQVGTTLVLAVPATDPDDGKVVKALVLQLVGFAAGIVLAHVGGVSLFRAFLGPDAGLSVTVDYILTGLLIGGGSSPMHVLVRFITERKVLFTPEAAAEAAPEPSRDAAPAPAVIVAPPPEDLDGWVDLPYDGGVSRERLEHVHLRPADPDLIVYHHTAMDSRSTFEDVVRVITNRTSGGGSWLTGYHCVILADGSVHPFCRWDRYGNHAVGHNRRSLGISFNGNFETDPSVPFANPDGRMGATRPTEEQLRAGARVVALWTFLYGIPVNFGASIVPHKQISSKACPGSQFPYDELQRWVEHYCARWGRSGEVTEHLTAFKLKPYLYRTEVRS